MLALLLTAVLCQNDLNMSGRPAATTSLVMSGHAPSTIRQLHFYGPTWCPVCPASLEAVKKDLGTEFDIVVHKDYGNYPAWVLAQGGKPGWGYPLLHWTNNSGRANVMLWSGVEPFRKADDKPFAQVAEYAPTPGQEVERVIGLLPKPQIGFVDYGCGDGRWCIAAAERWGCRVTGVEIDPARASAARERVKSAGLGHLVTIVTGDATTADVEADVGVAYLYSDVLGKLRPRIEKLRAFASYMHRPTGLPVHQNGDTWFYMPQSSMQSKAAVWQGRLYSQPVCDNPGCSMCCSIRQQLTR